MSARLRFEPICYWFDWLLRMHDVIAIYHVTMCIRISFWKYNTKNRTDYRNKSEQIHKIFYCYFLIFLLVSVPFYKAIINYLFISFLKLNNKNFFLLIFVFWSWNAAILLCTFVLEVFCFSRCIEACRVIKV
jgi:hypothetical protein